ncbi:YchJ family protein [Motilimonas cestriensis]|uniref:YchJ family protein n=1 Tax=Motilimonas cestriensis TaxID=2742685 RepID=A0ABS8W3H8_9GAMM|nr:YchJ family protein [Motilimonas cestriensis]MCE2593512.1 YchJ family protein [Motilimonas cestriensis]
MTRCHCGNDLPYEKCCQPLHLGELAAPTCEALMRSRFSAYIEQLGEYLFNTWHPDFRADLTPELLAQSGKETDWRSLQIFASQGGPNDNQGTVEFRAWFIADNTLQYHHEVSNFTRVAGAWVYTDGAFNPNKKSLLPGRNDPCPCMSQKKFKACCGK